MSDSDFACNTTVLNPFNQTLYDTCCPPELNTDVGGIGVRISFYLQALFLACLSARSGSLDEITGSLYTLVATNVAMAVTAFILGFKKKAEITLQDAIVVLYLLTLSWAAVFFSLPSYNRFRKSDRTLKYLSIVQSYILFGFAFAVLVKANSGFGQLPICNVGARVAIFRPFNILPVGRILALIAMSIVIAVYTTLTSIDYYPLVTGQIRDWMGMWRTWRQHRREKKHQRNKGGPSLHGTQASSTSPNGYDRGPTHQESMSTAPDRSKGTRGGGTKSEKSKSHHRRDDREEQYQTAYDLGISGNIIIENLVIFILWGMAVMNTELLIRWNRFQPSGDSQWQFGQILPVFLVVLPLINMIKAFRKYGFSRRVHRRKVHKSRTHKSSGRSHGLQADEAFGLGGGAGLNDIFSGGGFGDVFGLGAGVPPLFGGSGGGDLFGRPSPGGNNLSARISLTSIHTEGENNQIGEGHAGDSNAIHNVDAQNNV